MILEPRQQTSVSPGSSGDDVVRYLRVSIQQRPAQIIAAVIFVLLIIIELLLHHGLTATLAQVLPVIIVVLLDAIIALAIACGAAEPLAILAYLREVRAEQQPNSKLYTPLSAEQGRDETPLDPHYQGQQRDVRKLVHALKTHVMILGLPGAGKTMALRAYQYPTLEHPWRLLWKRESIPVYVPMKDYNVFLTRTYPPTYTAQSSLPPESVLAYLLNGSTLTGMSQLNPYLQLLARRGRLLFLYDGLNEIDSDYLELVCSELTQAIQAKQNRLVMTCRELDYREQPRLRKLVEDHLVEEALILPLKMEQIEDFVERYVQADYQSTQRQGRSAYEINRLIKTSRLSYNCTNPMMLVTLISIIDEFGMDQDVQIGTKGRLLHKFVFQLVARELKQPRWQSLNAQDIMLFLSQVACTARLNKLRNAIQLGRAGTVGEGGVPRTMPIEEVADRLQVWLVQHAPADTSVTGQLVPQVPQMRIYTHTEIEQFLGFVQSAALIDVSQNGVLSFHHELIAEYFAAAYLHQMDTAPHTSVPFGNELVTDVGAWSEPVTIWAGMSNEPMTLAQRLASLGQSNPHHAYNALSLSLACTGVVWTPPLTQEAQRVTVRLPDNVTNLLVSFVPDPVHRRNLAATIKRCADEGGVEVYRSLLPLIMEAGIDDLLLEIDKRAIPELLFTYLHDALETTMSPDHIDRLIYILGRFGTAVIERAKELSQPSPRVNIYLRVAAIKILGSSGTIQAVEPLIAQMGDAEDTMREATAKALIQLGAGMALERVLEELRSQVPPEKIGKIHWTALAVLRGFLSKHQQQLNPVMHQRIIEALLQALSSRYMPSVQENARGILLEQAGSTAQQQDEERWKRVVSSLIRALADMDAMKAPHVVAMLKQIGKAATPLLLLELQTSKLEIVRARIVEVLGMVRDQEALPPLLPYLADASPLVVQQVTIALCNFAPRSIAPLIDRVLHDPIELLARKAAAALKQIGASSLGQVMLKLEPIVPARTSLLIDVLVHIHQPQAIAPLIKLLKKLQNEADLSLTTIRALGQFPEKQVVPPLLEVLISWGPSQYEEARKALSSFGELAFDELIAALDLKMEAIKIQRVRFALLYMEPFLYERLLTTFMTCSEAQAREIELIFLQKDEAAPFLVAHLSDVEQLVREHVYNILDKMKRDTIIPPLLNGLKNTRDYAPIGRLLRKYPESIPSLVDLLGDERSNDGAAAILLEFGTKIIPFLVPGLDNQNPTARRRAQDILITLVQEERQESSQKNVLAQVVSLFGKLSPEQPQSYAWDSLLDVLTNRFPEQSISVLLEGLGQVKVQYGSAEALVRLVHKQDVYSNHVRTELLAALENQKRMNGASSALVKLGAEVV